MRKGIFGLCAVLVCAALFSGCAASTMAAGDDSTTAKIDRGGYSAELPQFTAPAKGDTIAVFDTSAGEFRAVLYPQYAPQACENFITLAESGYYNDTVFYRVESGFCIEAGLAADGTATTKWRGSGYPPEFTDQLHHYAGALCAAMDENGVGSSVFYVVQCLPDSVDDELNDAMAAAEYAETVRTAYAAVGGAPYLDYTDTVFGQVYSGMQTVDTIGLAETDEDGAPVEAITIRTVTITTFGAS